MLDKETIMSGHVQGWVNDFIDSMVDMEMEVVTNDDAVS